MDLKSIFEDFEDYLAPKLDTYEHAIYLYILRHSRLKGDRSVVIGFKSARKLIASGVGERGKPMSEGTCYEKLRSLEQKGCLKIVATEHKGTRVELFLPSEISGLVAAPQRPAELTIEEMDFFEVPANRRLILDRENGKCFYCLHQIEAATFVVEHVENRREAGNCYRNVVAACRGCNNKKGEQTAEDYLRGLYRDGLLSSEEVAERITALGELRAGNLKPNARGAVSAA